MTGTYASFQTDKELEKKGIELVLGEAGTFTIARAGGANQRFSKRLEALTKPHRRSIQTNTIAPDVAEGIMIQAYTECVIVGWEKVTDEEGKELPFTKDNVIKLMTDLPDLFSTIRQSAEDSSLYRLEVQETDSGNL